MIKYSYRFSLKSSDEDKPLPLRLRVTFNSKRVEIYTGINISSSQWNNDKQRITKNNPLNHTITKYISIIEDIFSEYEVIHKRYPTTEEFKVLFKSKQGKSVIERVAPMKFSELISLYMDEMATARQWALETHRSYMKLYNTINDFDSNLKVNDVTADTLRALVDYYLKPRRNSGKKKKSCRNTSIKRAIDNYIRILKWAEKKGIYKGIAHIDFDQKFKGTSDKLSEIIYLEWHELMALFNYDFKELKTYEQVRDIFCFCCFSSLRFSDAINLKWSNIYNDKINITTQKTSRSLVIELNNYARLILEKYEKRAFKDDFVFPRLNLYTINNILKEIGGILKFDTPIKEVYFKGAVRHEKIHLKKDLLSSHAGRRTFVVNALRLGIPAEVIIKWTGHSDFKNLKPYVKIVDELKEKEMDKFNYPQ